MKKLLSTLLVAGIVASVTFSGALAAGADERGYISVNSRAQKEFAPNVANVRFYIETSNKDLNEATEKNKTETTRALEAVKNLLDTSKGDSIKTVNFSVNPQYNYKNGTRTFVQYNVSNGFEVTLKNTDNLGKVISAGLKNGATRVGDLNFSLDNTESACNGLISEAVGISKTRASHVAGAAGTSITGIKSMDANCSGDGMHYARFTLNSAKMLSSSRDAAGAEDAAVPTEMGTIKLFATVNAQYFVK